MERSEWSRSRRPRFCSHLTSCRPGLCPTAVTPWGTFVSGAAEGSFLQAETGCPSPGDPGAAARTGRRGWSAGGAHGGRSAREAAGGPGLGAQRQAGRAGNLWPVYTFWLRRIRAVGPRSPGRELGPPPGRAHGARASLLPAAPRPASPREGAAENEKSGRARLRLRNPRVYREVRNRAPGAPGGIPGGASQVPTGRARRWPPLRCCFWASCPGPGGPELILFCSLGPGQVKGPSKKAGINERIPWALGARGGAKMPQASPGRRRLSARPD